ncbi:hypothetical protein, partial [Mesorhizobium sp.]|uniref:hypothetical protein n=1 Tax=Mesorhizobium sp. TaxID=1871066 RepID=UPI0025EA22A8
PAGQRGVGRIAAAANIRAGNPDRHNCSSACVIKLTELQRQGYAYLRSKTSADLNISTARPYEEQENPED